jgi:tetratricopeptide (TPR) repeat protein
MQVTAQRGELQRVDPVQARAAIDRLSQAVNGNPNDVEARWHRAQIYAEVGNLSSALDDLDRILKLQPGHYLAVVKRGDCKLHNADVVGAFRDYADAVRLQPDRPEAYFARGLSLAEQYEYKDAITNFDRAIALAPNDAKIYRARARAQRARASKAVADGEVDNISVSVNSAFGSSFDPKIMALAIEDFTRAISIDDNLRTRLDRASTLDSAERWEEALKEYRYVVERTKAPAALDPRGEAAALLRMAAEGEKEMLAYLGDDMPEIKPKATAAKPADLDAFKAALNQTIQPKAVNTPATKTPARTLPAGPEKTPAAQAAKATAMRSADKATAQAIRAEREEKSDKPQAAAVVDTSSVPINEVRIAPPAPSAPSKPSGSDRLLAKRYARRVVAHVREGVPEFAKLKQPYRHLNLRFYESARAEFEASQFKHIVNVEPLHVTRPLGIKTFWSVLVSPSGRTVAIVQEIYDEPASVFARLRANVLGNLPNRVSYVELISEFSDNAYVVTNNIGDRHLFDPPPNIELHAMERGVDINRVVGMHRSRMDDYLSEHPGVQSSVVRSWKDFTGIIDRMRLQKIASRRGVSAGASDVELQRLAGKDYVRVAALIREELATLLAQR